jgi:hypothetical protein
MMMMMMKHLQKRSLETKTQHTGCRDGRLVDSILAVEPKRRTAMIWSLWGPETAAKGLLSRQIGMQTARRVE